jgi:hypothetical protein
VAQEDALRLGDLPRAPPALRVVQRDDEVGVGDGVEAAGDRRPGGQQVGQRDGAEVVRQRRADQRGAGVEAEAPGTISTSIADSGVQPAWNSTSKVGPAMP